MAIEIVDFPMKHGDFPWQNASFYQRVSVEVFSVGLADPGEELIELGEFSIIFHNFP